MINTLRLVLDIIGACLLLFGEMYHDAAFLKYSGTGEGKEWFDSKLAKLSWNKRWPLAIGRALGSRNVMNMNQDTVLDSFPIKFCGIVLLILGFPLQAIGSFTCQK